MNPFRYITRRQILTTSSKYTTTMASPPILAGQPEIYPLSTPTAPSQTQNHLPPVPAAGKPPSPLFQMTAVFNNNNNNTPKPPMRPIENLSPMFQSSGNPCLDLFNMVWSTPRETVTELLRRSWDHNPLTTLKLILRRRMDCYHCDEAVLYTLVFWLYQNHPKTLALNVRWFAQVGYSYMKFLLDIIFHQVACPDALQLAEAQRALTRRYGNCYASPRELRPILVKQERLKAKLARRAVEKYNSDSNYRLLYDEISDFLADSLRSDMEFLASGRSWKLGRAVTWCPDPDLPLEYSTLVCESIAKRIFPRESDPSYAQIHEDHYSCIVRNRLRREILDPLKSHLPYRYRKEAKAPEGVHVPSGFPHEILSFKDNNIMDDDDASLSIDEAELQWKTMVEDFSSKGKQLGNWLSVCHVYDGMDCLEVSVALGLLTSELSQEPWRGHVISFSPNPQLRRIQGETLQEKVEFIKRMEWGMNVDFQKVFDQILDVAVALKLEEEKMVKRVFVFSHMRFDEASGDSWERDYDAIKRKYEEKGYGSSVPEIVFWNLSDRLVLPAAGREKEVALVTGFSKNLLNIFLGNGGVVKPEEVMEDAIAGEEYQSVRVFD